MPIIKLHRVGFLASDIRVMLLTFQLTDTAIFFHCERADFRYFSSLRSFISALFSARDFAADSYSNGDAIRSGVLEFNSASFVPVVQ